jgi:hypothetical protein
MRIACGICYYQYNMSETSKQPADSPFDKISQLIADPEATPTSLGDFDRLRDRYFDALLAFNHHPKDTPETDTLSFLRKIRKKKR